MWSAKQAFFFYDFRNFFGPCMIMIMQACKLHDHANYMNGNAWDVNVGSWYKTLHIEIHSACFSESDICRQFIYFSA